MFGEACVESKHRYLRSLVLHWPLVVKTNRPRMFLNSAPAPSGANPREEGLRKTVEGSRRDRLMSSFVS